jgi:hypothetical protein
LFALSQQISLSLEEECSMAKKINHLETKLIHSGEPEPLSGGAVSMPIFQSSTFE